MNSRSSPLVMIVDDDDDVLVSLAMVVGYVNGYTVLQARGYYDALSKVRAYPVDVVVTDCDMPGPSGILLTQKLRDVKGKAFPIIVMSARPEREDEALLAGALFFMNKPVEPMELTMLIEASLNPVPLSNRSAG